MKLLALKSEVSAEGDKPLLMFSRTMVNNLTLGYIFRSCLTYLKFDTWVYCIATYWLGMSAVVCMLG